jgi:hypothetical protein
MCTGFEIAALALAGGGAYLQSEAADDAADEQRKILNAADEQTKKLNKQKQDLTQKFAEETFNPANRDQKYEEAATKQEESLVDALLKASDGTVAGAAEGNVSNDYIRGKAAASSSATEDILKRAKLMARQDAAGLMYNDEALKSGQLSSDLSAFDYAGNNVNRNAQNAFNQAANQGSLIGGLMTGISPLVGGYKSPAKVPAGSLNGTTSAGFTFKT